MIRSTTRLSRLRERLRGRIRTRYNIVEQDLKVGPLSLKFTRVVDPDVVLDQIAEEEDLRERLSGTRTQSDLLHLPYWAELWDSAFAIGSWLARGKLGGWEDGTVGGWKEESKAGVTPSSSQPFILPSSHHPTLRPCHRLSVLDLGCGMGLSGTVAAAVGHRVLFADLEPPALLFARLNSAPYGTHVRTRQLNWQTDRLNERFDLIVGADILYERKQWDFLEPFWRHHLYAGGQVLLGEPGRQTGELFVGWIKERGWRLNESLGPVATRPKPIRLFHLSLESRDAMTRPTAG